MLEVDPSPLSTSRRHFYQFPRPYGAKAGPKGLRRGPAAALQRVMRPRELQAHKRRQPSKRPVNPS